MCVIHLLGVRICIDSIINGMYNTNIYVDRTVSNNGACDSKLSSMFFPKHAHCKDSRVVILVARVF